MTPEVLQPLGEMVSCTASHRNRPLHRDLCNSRWRHLSLWKIITSCRDSSLEWRSLQVASLTPTGADGSATALGVVCRQMCC